MQEKTHIVDERQAGAASVCNPLLDGKCPAPDKLVYRDDSTLIYCGDMRELLPELGNVGHVITDAPFAIKDKPLGARKKLRGGNTWHETSEWDKEFKPEWCQAACGAASVIAWFGSWKRRQDVEAAMKHPLRQEIIWAKDIQVTPPAPLACMRDERIWIFSEKAFKPRTFETTVWDEPVIPTWKYKHHKNEKPLALMKRLIRFLTDEGDLICDPFMGSGTTLKAAKELGRRAIGIDINRRYCEIAATRLSQVTKAIPGQGQMAFAV